VLKIDTCIFNTVTPFASKSHYKLKNALIIDTDKFNDMTSPIMQTQDDTVVGITPPGAAV